MFLQKKKGGARKVIKRDWREKGNQNLTQRGTFL